MLLIILKVSVKKMKCNCNAYIIEPEIGGIKKICPICRKEFIKGENKVRDIHLPKQLEHRIKFI